MQWAVSLMGTIDWVDCICLTEDSVQVVQNARTVAGQQPVLEGVDVRRSRLSLLAPANPFHCLNTIY